MREQQVSKGGPLDLFISYAHEDEALRRELEKHLSLLHQQGLISSWHDRQIVPGTNWAQEVDRHLGAATLILLLISADFLASEYCYGTEMEYAMARHRAGAALVIPILLRPLDWSHAPFAVLQVLPRDAKPVTSWSNRDEAWLDVVTGIRRAVAALSGSSSQKRSHPTPTLTRQNRERLLKRVRVFWVEGVLEQSLHKAALIELGLKEQPDALANPWHLIVQESNRVPRPLPAGTHITQIYDQTRGELLILGEPGAGKTTLLLELARNLLTRAEADDTLPMPVMFNLSSWAVKRGPIADWLVEELRIRYQVPRKLGRAWIGQESVLPLLDGLDEVKEDARSACIAAINTYHTHYQHVPLIVCSRTTEYFAQERRLVFLSAVTIQPLTLQQIDGYLSNAQGQLETVREALRTHPILHDLITTPLFLSVLILAYQGGSIDDLPRSDLREVQKHLFAAYVERMLKRRSHDQRFPQAQTIQWLSWLARQMVSHNQTIFFIEGMQLSWLSGRLTYVIARVFVGMLTLLLCVVLGLLVGLFGALLLIWPFPNFDTYVPDVLGGPLIGGLLAGIVGGFIGGLRAKIPLVERMKWSWKQAGKRFWMVLVMELVIEFIVSGIYILSRPITWHAFFEWLFWKDLLYLLWDTLPITLSVALVVGFSLGGLSAVMEEVKISVKPNEGIWRSVRSSIRYGAFWGMPIGLLAGLLVSILGLLLGIFSQNGPRPFSSAFLLTPVVMLLIGLVTGLLTGGLTGIQHFVLRWLLRRRKCIPRRLVPFLDYATERIFLHKVGGGYIFIHRLLLDYFASSETPSVTYPPPKRRRLLRCCQRWVRPTRKLFVSKV